MEIKSIWDGWQNQFRRSQINAYDYWTSDNWPATCAMGFIGFNRADLVERVAAHILREFQLEDIASIGLYQFSRPDNVIIFANNELHLTPEDFRRIDRETQIEAVTKPLIDSVEFDSLRV